ncbi:MAG: dienelactone hydrolase family protein [Pseudomonadota bacterium]
MLNRRTVLKSASGAAAGLPLAAVLSDPILRSAVAQGLDTVSLDLPSGRTVNASLAVPAETPAGAVLLVHEWWGLNDQIRAVAAELANLGYVALAVDLMDNQVAETPQDAQAQMAAVVAEEATETLVAWIDWLRASDLTNGKIATVGWCFGGGWSLQASLATPVDGTIIYYGRVPGDAAELATLQSPVLGHFASQDQFIDTAMVTAFESALEESGAAFDLHTYDANHAFANPTSAAHDSEDAQLAWQRTLEFLEQTIGG